MIATFFPGLSVLPTQLLKGSKLLGVLCCYVYQILAPYYTVSLSCHLFHFAADYVSLSCNKMAIFPTLWYTASF